LLVASDVINDHVILINHNILGKYQIAQKPFEASSVLIQMNQGTNIGISPSGTEVISMDNLFVESCLKIFLLSVIFIAIAVFLFVELVKNNFHIGFTIINSGIKFRHSRFKLKH
jgi:hypothetical protein